jgi:hypothetical protein
MNAVMSLLQKIVESRKSIGGTQLLSSLQTGWPRSSETETGKRLMRFKRMVSGSLKGDHLTTTSLKLEKNIYSFWKSENMWAL